MVNGTNVTVSDQQLDHNGAGIYFRNTSSSLITNVSSSSNINGIYLDLGGSDTVNGSRVTDNLVGITLRNSDNNRVYNNLFSNGINVNTRFARRTGNLWNTTPENGTNIVGGSSIGGNYWGDSGWHRVVADPL